VKIRRKWSRRKRRKKTPPHRKMKEEMGRQEERRGEKRKRNQRRSEITLATLTCSIMYNQCCIFAIKDSNANLESNAAYSLGDGCIE
jgi:hypothetical protein